MNNIIIFRVVFVYERCDRRGGVGGSRYRGASVVGGSGRVVLAVAGGTAMWQHNGKQLRNSCNERTHRAGSLSLFFCSLDGRDATQSPSTAVSTARPPPTLPSFVRRKPVSPPPSNGTTPTFSIAQVPSTRTGYRRSTYTPVHYIDQSFYNFYSLRV